MSKAPSLLRSLAVDIAVIQAVAMAALFVLLPNQLDVTVQDLETRDMHGAAMELAAHLSVKDHPRLVLDPAAAARFSPSYGRYAYAILDDAGRPLLSSSEPPGPLSTDLPSAGRDLGQFKVRSAGRMLWGLSIRTLVDDVPVWVQVAEDMNHRDALLDEIAPGFLVRAVGILLPLFLMLMVFVLLRMKRRIRPLVAASASGAAIDPRHPGGRIAADGIPGEIRPLVAASNSALDRMETAFRLQREFLENAAHELKTPLAVLRARIDGVDDPALRRELETDLATMSRLVTQMLRAAEMEGISGQIRAEVNLERLARAIAGYLSTAAALTGKRIDIVEAAPGEQRRPALVSGCPETIGQAINNLVENALSHTDSAVELSVSGGPNPEIRVRDHGPGIPDQEKELVFERFWRRDRRKGTGAGLGLSIVRRAMELHGGTARVEDAPGGGAVFILAFPVQDGNSHDVLPGRIG